MKHANLIETGLWVIIVGSTMMMLVLVTTLTDEDARPSTVVLILVIQSAVTVGAIMLYRRTGRVSAAQVFTGTCVVCGESVSMEYRPSEGLVDIAVDEDRQVYTWIRHIDGPQSSCDIYSSRVWLDHRQEVSS